MIEVHDPENREILKRLYIIASVDPEGKEGIIALQRETKEWYPLITGNYEAAKKYLEMAEKTLPKESNKRVTIIRFKREEKA